MKTDENTAKTIRKKLLDWYDVHARSLPWRSQPTPYRVWVSEIMLQQTQVDVVIPYFERFVREVGSVSELARLSDDRLMKLWQGLGYYRRAQNLKLAATMMVETFNHQVPDTIEDLRKLPGIGEYTAGAIASIAYGRNEIAVDGNVLRIVARLQGLKEDISRTQTKKKIAETVRIFLSQERPGDFNQALMDLGATICTPGKQPSCAICPLCEECKANQEETVGIIPVKKAKTLKKTEKRTVLIVICEDRIALKQRDSSALLGNLFEPLNKRGHLSVEQILETTEAIGLNVTTIEETIDAKHVFSHLIWDMRGYMITVESKTSTDSLIWATSDEIAERYSIPNAFKRYLALAYERIESDKSIKKI